jgi:tetratricopeptide (TPR) repeat protein
VEAVPAAPAPEVVPAAWPGRPTSVARAAPPPAVEARREAPPAAPAPPDGTAADVFSAATRARLGGDRPLAVARYRQLLASWPASEEAAQTRASLGRLLLDEGAPTAALELLDGYLRGPDGTLREEVLAARAQALSRLGRAAEEARAWQALVEQYPESIHATRGRYRLSSLSTPRPE